jgi:hypothetical protein
VFLRQHSETAAPLAPALDVGSLVDITAHSARLCAITTRSPGAIWMLAHDAVRRPVRTLITVFAAWKLFLFLIAAGSTVGPAYDTSGGITLDVAGTSNGSAPALLARLTSWDAIYFTQVARRGYLFEQEWAFGSGLTIVIEYLVKSMFPYPCGVGVQPYEHLCCLRHHIRRSR